MTRLVNITNYHSDERLREQKTAITDKAKELGWTHYVDGLPVSKELEEFATAVKAVMPNVTLLPVDNEYLNTNLNGSDVTIRVYCEFTLAMEGYPFGLGQINYTDNSVRSNNGNTKTYGVYSRKISNAKYGTHRNQHRMIMSNDVKKAVKNACKYIVPFSTRELAQAFYDPMQNNASRAFNKAERALKDHCNPLGYHYKEVAEELINLKAKGVTFKNEIFNRVTENLEDLYATYNHESTRNISATFVRIYQVGDVSYVSLQEVPNIKQHSWKATAEEPVLDKPVSELPEETVGAISVLSILENNQYASNVGMKLDGNHFWIERG
jgi:hypothetical protein